MTWSEQSESLLKTWSEVQKKLIESSLETLQGLSSPTTMFPGMGLFDQWQKLVGQGFETLTSGAEPTSKNLSRQLVAAQATMMRFLEMTTRAWNVMIPKLQEGQDWQSILSNYMDDFRKQMTNPTRMMQSVQGMTNLWQTYLQQMQPVMQPWMNVMMQAPGHIGVASAGEGGTELIELTRMYWNAYDQTMGRIVGMPSVGFTRELEEKFAKGYVAWNQAREAMDEYQLVIADAWSGVMEQVLREMMTRAEQGKPIESVRDLVRMWTSAADKSFDQVFRSERYTEVQGKFVSSYMEYRVHEQQIVDEVMKYGYIPSRTEMDEANRNIYELRKEVKALKKALLNGKQSSVSSASSVKPSTPKTETSASSA